MFLKMMFLCYKTGLMYQRPSGPDKLHGRLLPSLAKEITPIVHNIFTQSLCTGKLPTEWIQANVAPIFKKGSKLIAKVKNTIIL